MGEWLGFGEQFVSVFLKYSQGKGFIKKRSDKMRK